MPRSTFVDRSLRRIPPALWVLAALGVAVRPAAACSRHEGYAEPSSFESVMLADAVALVRSDSVERDPGGAEPGFRGHFTVLETIAGGPLETELEIAVDEVDDGRSPSDSFLTGRPAGDLCCFCVSSWGFAPGNLYVLLLQRSDGGYGVGTLQREAEQVDGPDAPWTLAVRHYARIARLAPAAERRAALLELRDLAARGDDPARYPPALVADIDDHLARPHPSKGFEELAAMLEAQSDPAEARKVLWSLETQDDARSGAYFRSLLDDGLRGHRLDEPGWATLLEPIAAHALRKGALDLVERLVTIFPRLDPEDREGARYGTTRHAIAGAVHASCARIPASWVLTVAAGANDEELAALAMDDHSHDLCGPAVAEVRRRVGREYDRAGSLLGPVLARAGDDDLARWADARIGAGTWEQDFAASLLVISPGAEANAAIRRRIEEGADAVFAELVPVLLSEEVPERDERLAAIAARLAVSDLPYPKLSAALDDWRRQFPAEVAALDRALERPGTAP